MITGESWGRHPRVAQTLYPLQRRDATLPEPAGSMLPHGFGRSYGDSCLNPDGLLLLTSGLDRYIEFDPDSGLLRCESGVSLRQIVDLMLPRGWLPPVLPGTGQVSVGGAIANDVHGKNHQRVGSFGHHVRAFELLRSDGSRLLCSADSNADWFRATIGGLGLTGLITWAEIALARVPGPWLSVRSQRFARLAEFLPLSASAAEPYNVAWIDCCAQGDALGRGIFSAASPASTSAGPPAPGRRPGVPMVLPLNPLNRASLRAFNSIYWHRHPRVVQQRLQHCLSFFHPLDAIARWNRLYGPRGFLQYQCVLPPASAEAGIAELLQHIRASGQGSFLAVLKQFGEHPPAGLLSFPRVGTTLALDFPNRGRDTSSLLAALDEVVAAAGGAIYPAKDARMPAALFHSGFPQWQRFADFVDPAFSSGFWRRVTA